jgi:SagB-type dehydrogenase family enzyme
MDEKIENRLKIFYETVFHKVYQRLEKIPLPDKDIQTPLDKLILKRESVRKFSKKNLRFEVLSSILSIAKVLDISRQPEKRSYPSGGARFPLELYVLISNCEKLEKGLYHFNILDNSLEILLKEDLDYLMNDFCTENITNPSAVIIITSVKNRIQIKYGKKKGRELYLIEAGHLAQNLILKCVENDISSCPVAGFKTQTIKTKLDLTNYEEVIYTLPIGIKE